MPTSRVDSAIFLGAQMVQMAGRLLLHCLKLAQRRKSANFKAVNISLLPGSMVPLETVKKCKDRGA